MYFLGAYYSRDNDLYELNTSTGACKKIESFGRTAPYGRMLVSNNILILPNYQNKIFLLKGKVKRFKGVLGRRTNTKKAIVTLEPGNTIDLSVGV